MPLADHIANRPGAWDKIEILEEHVHNAQCVYPTLASAVTVAGAAGAWALGNFVEIVPVNTIAGDFDLHWINIEDVSATGSYELVLYVETTEIARARFHVTGTPANVIISPLRVQTPILAANSQVQMKIASSSGGSDTVDVSIEYHTY